MEIFDAEKEVNNIVEFIRKYYKENNLNGVIIGISGGKDSAVVSAIFTKALGKENVIGVTIPCHSNVEDFNDAKLISDYYGFRLINLDITSVFDTFKNEVNKLGDFSKEELKNSDINIKPRLRMTTLYYLAALYSAVEGKRYLVAGTSNKSELFVGYFTKGGDSVSDISTIADFTVEEVIKIGEYLKVPEKVLYKTPSDGLSSQNDEEKLGVKYSDISLYMEDKSKLPKDVQEKIEKLHKSNQHKFNIPTYKR
jgi:NAD+ synthase